MPARRRARGDGGVVRLMDANGSSGRSWDAAVADAVKSVRDEVPRPLGVEVARMWADLDGKGRISTYHVAVKVAYRQELEPPTRS